MPRFIAQHDSKLARALILDELFDLTLYERFQQMRPGHLGTLLEELSAVERRHYQFWQDFFGRRFECLDISRRFRMGIIVATARVFGEPVMHLVLNAIEIYGIRKYLRVWDIYKGTPLGDAVKGILEDEFRHEDAIVAKGVEAKISAERIRNIFLGFNDGLVELLGAVSGFFAAFSNNVYVMLAGFTVAVAGAISMAAGIFAASGSEREINNTIIRKKKFLGESGNISVKSERPFGSAVIVGISYILGALIPLFPIFFGARNILFSLLFSSFFIAVVSYILAFISGMDIRRRIFINLIVIAIAVSVAYAIGMLAKIILGVAP